MPRSTPSLVALAAAVLLLQAVAVAPLPLLSDDWSHRATTAAFASSLDAFDPALVPLRPLQWWTFHAIVDADHPIRSRLPAALLLGASAWLVHALARRLGAEPRGAALAMLAFAAFGHVTNLGWPAAIGWPGRTFGLLLGLHGYLAWLERRSIGAAVAVVAGQLVALGFHQSAVILPVWCALAAFAREGPAALGRRARDPLTWLLAAIVVPYVVHVAWFRPVRGHSGVPLAALPASVFRAATFWVPEPLRHAAEDAARAGGAAQVLGALPAMVGIGLAGVAIARGGVARLLAAAIAVDVTFAAVFAGFRPRYAPTAAALLAIGLARALAPVRGLRFGIGVAIVAAWLVGTARDVIDFRRVGPTIAALRAAVLAADREAPPGATLVLVDVPGELDRDLDVPLFRYGLRDALRDFGVTRPVELWSVDATRGVAGASRRTAADVAAAHTRDDLVVLRFDPVDGAPRREADR